MSAAPPSNVTVGTSASPNAVPLSADAWIVYQWSVGSNDALFEVHPDGSERHRIVASINDALLHPDWSPDGRRLAFERLLADGHAEIWSSDADGSQPVSLVACQAASCRQVFHPAWSPDGHELAYARWDDPDGDAVAGDRLSIEVIDLASGVRRVVARGPAVGRDYEEYVYPRWSGDGAQIVFTITEYSNPPKEPINGSRIAIVKSDGSQADHPRVITDGGMFGAYADWNRVDDRIVFTTYDLSYFQTTAEASNLYGVRPDGTDLRQLTTFPKGGTRATQPTWTPDGEAILFTRISGDRMTGVCDKLCSSASASVIDGGSATHPRLQPTASH